MGTPSKRLVAAYTLDWILIIAIAAVGGGLNFVSSKVRPFSLLDLSISFPFVQESISVTTLALVALLAPAVIIFLVVLFAVPAASTCRTLTKPEIIRHKLWELHAGLAGLALSVALGFFVTQGLKNIVGKPRPHFLTLCQPVLTDIARHAAGGYGQDISARWTLVNPSICSQPNAASLKDGFRSFPSGHCSWSWSGLLYLSLFLSVKFSVAIPHLEHLSKSAYPAAEPAIRASTTESIDTEMLPLHNIAKSRGGPAKRPMLPIENSHSTSKTPLYNQAATPPNYGIVLVLIPLGVATYISTTRYAEFWHFGFDVLSGALIGIFSAWFSFRWYHTPIGRGGGWAWGPRSRGRAFGIGVGVEGYVGPEGWESP